MNRELLDRYCERAILGLVVAILLFGPLALGAVRALEFAAIEVLTLAVLVLWAARLWLAPKPQLLWPPICWAVLAFTGYAIARYLTADVEYVARQELVRVLVYAILFLAILNNLHRQEATTLISFSVIFLGLAISGYAIYQFFKNSDYVWNFIKPYPHRGSGTYICPNHLGGFLELLIPLALAYALTGRLKPVTKVLLGYAALVMLAGIAVTISRGAWLATALALVLFFGALMFRHQYRLPVLVVLALLAIAGAVALPKSYFIQERWGEFSAEEKGMHENMRYAMWRPAWEMWLDHPWWGVGPAHFDTRFRQYRPEGVQLSPYRAHNDYLNTLADWGVVGLALVLTALVLLGIGVAQTWRSRRLAANDLGSKSTSNKYAFVLGASLGLLAILVHSFVDFNMHIPANALLVITWMALLSGHLRFVTEQWWLRARVLVKAIVTVATLAAVAYLGPQACRQASEFVWLDRAAKAPNFSQEQIARLKQAFAVEPKNAQTAMGIAVAYQRQSQEGGQQYASQPGVDYRLLAQEALRWFEQAMKLDPWESRNYTGCGWCLDWLEQPEQSAPYFVQAEELDPNNYFTLNQIGLHYVQQGDYAAAKPWFQRSARLESEWGEIARNYLGIIQARLLEGATNDLQNRLNLTVPAEIGLKNAAK